jgi:rhodanese-related sulfurtransferase
MERRTVLGASATALAGLAGCLGLGGDGGGTAADVADPNPDDGYPPAFDEVPEAEQFSEFDSLDRDGETVTLAPIEAVHNWYRRREARFVDARSATAYGQSHIYGAVSSPVDTAVGESPVGDWDAGERIVCYCGCPHHLSSIRAATLQSEGYTDVYVLDEGFYAWRDAGYLLAGEDVSGAPAAWAIAGVVDAAHAGADAWVYHPPTGQMEATAIGDDGRFDLHLRFYDVSANTPLRVETPDYSVEAPLGQLADGVVGPGRIK